MRERHKMREFDLFLGLSYLRIQTSSEIQIKVDRFIFIVVYCDNILKAMFHSISSNKIHSVAL